MLTHICQLFDLSADRYFGEPQASAPGKSANFDGLQGRAFAPFLRQEASTAVVLVDFLEPNVTERYL
jgi:hypothetical protein